MGSGQETWCCLPCVTLGESLGLSDQNQAANKQLLTLPHEDRTGNSFFFLRGQVEGAKPLSDRRNPPWLPPGLSPSIPTRALQSDMWTFMLDWPNQNQAELLFPNKVGWPAPGHRWWWWQVERAGLRGRESIVAIFPLDRPGTGTPALLQAKPFGPLVSVGFF